MTYTKAGGKASRKYKDSHYKRIPLEVSIDKYDQIKEHASKHSESVNGFIKRAIDETMERDSSV